MRPRVRYTEVQPCEKHEWVDYKVNKQLEGLICRKCFKRPG